MKKFFLAIAAVVMLAACNNGPKTPVDEIIDIMEAGKEYLFDKSDSDKGQEISAKLEAVYEANKDYVLTSSDKKKFVKEVESLMNYALKSIDDETRAAISAMGMDINSLIDAQLKNMKEGIDKCETLGDLEKLDMDL
jgi:hypothetical protein